jgi:hypothetical protein
MKTYSYKNALCQDLTFSSSSCLSCHKREVHAMHGNGDKPHHCTHEGCEHNVPGNGFPRLWNLRDHMKRVHSFDPIPPKSKAGRYTSVPGESAKGTKRKATSTDLDENPKSSGTPPADIHQLHKARLIENYHQHKQRLLEIVKQLHDPRNASHMLLWGATNCITVMAQTIERIKGASASENCKQTNTTKQSCHSIDK